MQIVTVQQIEGRSLHEYFRGENNLIHYWAMQKAFRDTEANNELYGPDILLGHGNFSIDADPWWTSISAGWSILAGVATSASAVTNNQLIKNAVIESNLRYTSTYSVTRWVSGNVRLGIGGNFIASRNAVGTYTQQAISEATGQLIVRTITPVPIDLDIDNLTVRRVYNNYEMSMHFDGVNDGLQTEAVVQLDMTNKVTLFCNFKFSTYDLINDCILFETSANATLNAGCFVVSTKGSVVGDPLSIIVNGNVGITEYQYLLDNTKFRTGRYYQIAIVIDMTPGDNRILLYVDGKLLIPDSIVAVNNTDVFSNQILNIGSRDGASNFIHGNINQIGVFTRVLFWKEIFDFYIWSNNVTNKQMATLAEIYRPRS